MPKGIKKIPGPCLIPGCNRPNDRRGWCKDHYTRWWRYGDPLGGRCPDGEPLRFLQDALAHKPRSSECWEWPYGKSGDGYGVIYVNKQQQRVSHFTLLSLGLARPAPPNHHALHSCDNPPCFNPQHLRWGSQKDNEGDKIGRDRHARGERNGYSKLTETQVLAIRADTRKATLVGPEYDIWPETVRAIRARKTWRHI